jgi:predicted metal-dependent hydrolase
MDDTNLQSIEVEGIGRIKIRRRRGQKSTTLRLAKSGGIVLSTNYSTPLYSLKKFVLENRAWLEEVRAKNGLFDTIEIFDGQSLTTDLKFKIAVQPGLERPKFSYRKGRSEIVIKTSRPGDSVTLDEDSRIELERFVIKAIRERAQAYLPKRLEQVATHMGASYESVTIRNTSSRWGSCSSHNDINLSLWLMILPSELIDYVIIHELSHTWHKHHGKEFWNAVARFEPDYKSLRVKLKKYSSQIWW